MMTILRKKLFASADMTFKNLSFAVFDRFFMLEQKLEIGAQSFKKQINLKIKGGKCYELSKIS